VLAIAARHLVSHPALISAPPTVLTKLNKVSIIWSNCSNTILAAPRQLLEMADGNGNGDGRWRWQLQWLTVTETEMANGRATVMEMADRNAAETAAAMVDGDCNGNGQRRQQR
jgi:hypothetical protein